MQEHPHRRALIDELHARPFAEIAAPCDVVFLACKHPQNAVGRDRAAERSLLADRLVAEGLDEKRLGNNHFLGPVGDDAQGDLLKWEQHSEFTSLALFRSAVAPEAFAFDDIRETLENWAEGLTAPVLVKVSLRVEHSPEDPDAMGEQLERWFNAKSLAAARILDGTAVLAGDFQLDAHGHMRFALFVPPSCSPARVGQLVQSVLEIETYRAMSMLGLDRARKLAKALTDFDQRLEDIILAMAKADSDPEGLLFDLLNISSTLEEQAALMTFRFGATEAYNAIVHDRIELLREQRLAGLQTFHEFMMRRFDPAIRTVSSTQDRLNSQLNRTTRTAELLRTQVDVSRSAQSQTLLTSMDRRNAVQLRLQRTVEGLSVIAISYYAVNLLAGFLFPMAQVFDFTKAQVTAALVLPVVILVALMIRRVRLGEGKDGDGNGDD